MGGRKEDVVRIHANITYSYAILRAPAKAAAQSVRWKDEEKIKNLKFTDKWVRGFLTRASMTRRKITTEDKVRPSEEIVRAAMMVGREKYIRNNLRPVVVHNFDKTAINWCTGPTHIFLPYDKFEKNLKNLWGRHLGVSNIKLRMTAIIAFEAEGGPDPLFIIIRHSAKVTSKTKPNQLSIRVIQNLFKANLGFGAEDGWELKTWEKNMTIDGVEQIHKCWYLKHNARGHIINVY